MARLTVKTAGLEHLSIEPRLGVNRIGRSPASDFQIVHPTVSALHCELVLEGSGLILRDLESTNGTFVGGKRIRETKLSAGETIRLGQVELFVETVEVTVAIPKFINPDLPAPPVVSSDGAMICPRHPHAAVTHQCTACKEVMCAACVHRLRRKGSRSVLLLCPICSNPVRTIGEPAKPHKKKSLLERLGETVKLKITRAIRLTGGRR